MKNNVPTLKINSPDLNQALFRYYGKINVKQILNLLYEFDTNPEHSEFNEFLKNYNNNGQ
jgi:hypothetical protein